MDTDWRKDRKGSHEKQRRAELCRRVADRGADHQAGELRPPITQIYNVKVPGRYPLAGGQGRHNAWKKTSENQKALELWEARGPAPLQLLA